MSIADTIFDVNCLAVENIDRLSDEELMYRFQRASERACIEKLIERHQYQAMALARSYLFDQQDAEDVLQDSFIKLIRYKDKYRCEQSFGAWYYTLLRRLCIDVLRKRKLRSFLLLNASRDEQSTEEHQSSGELRFLDSLPKKEQEVLRLRIVSDLPFQEIATILGCSEEAAKKRAQRGLNRLREKMSMNS